MGSFETILIAAIASMGAALVGLIPMFAKLRSDTKREAAAARAAEAARVDELEAKRQTEITDVTQKAIQETIRRLSARVEDLEKDRDTLEGKLDEERQKRRAAEAGLARVELAAEARIAKVEMAAEARIAKAEREIERLNAKVTKLEKRDTGPLKGQQT